MEIIGYFSALLIGLSLGLIGGGGSILTVPVLVYLFGVSPIMATAYSLFIVGMSSAVGAVSKFKSGLVDLRTAIVFGIPSIISVYLTRAFVLPAMPDQLFTIGRFEMDKPLFILLLFAVLMIAASVSMIRGRKQRSNIADADRKFNYPLILVEGLVVGFLTGLVGAGGGFLIIPALVVLSQLPMKKAVGTSLVIIASKSLIGFLGDLGQATIDWTLLLTISILAVGGIFLGNALSKKIDGQQLKKGFGWFVLIMGIYIILKEL